MELIKWEIKKILSLPMIVIFLVLCIVFNFILMTDGFFWNGGIDYVRYINQVTKKIGGQMGEEFDKMAAALPKQEEKTRLLAETEGRVDCLEDYQTAEIADYYIGKFQITGVTANILKHKYQRLQARVEELAKQDASMSLAAAGITNRLLKHLFERLCKTVITQGMLLAIFIALYLCGNEQMQRTHWIVYTTRKGRRIQQEKWVAGIGISLLAYGILAGCMVIGFSGIWRMGEIWNGKMSSQFYTISDLGVSLPFVSCADFTIRGYLAAVIGMGMVVVILFYNLGYAIGLLIPHTYFGFLVILVLVAINFELIMMAGNGGMWGLYELALWSPVGVWWESPVWFSELGVSRMVKWQECWVGGIWSGICFGFSWIGLQLFYKKEL